MIREVSGGAPRGRKALALGCFFLSGASALVYEVVWMRQLQLVIGSTTAAVSTILAVFMAGLALGAYLFGRLADRCRAPIKLYAYLELGIGTYALLLPHLMSWAEPGYVGLARVAEGHPLVLTLIRVALGFALLLTPTVLMGATLPVLLRFVSGSASRFGWDLGSLYGANLTGAVVGCAASGFVLIQMLGLRGATLAAAVANLLVAAVALLVGGTAGAVGEAGSERPSGTLPAGTPPRALLWGVVLLSGLVSMGYEVLWTRILVTWFQATVYSFTIILATFLAGLALGSWLFASIGSWRQHARTLAVVEIAAGLAALLLVPLSTKLPGIVGFLTDRFGLTGGVYLGATALCAALLILPPATLMGVVFPLGSRLLVGDLQQLGRRVGQAFFVNTLGSVVGALATGFVLIPALSLKGCLALFAGIQVLVGWSLLPWCGWSARRGRVVLAASGLGLVMAFVLLISLLPGPNPFDVSAGGEAAGSVLEAHRDGVASSVSVVRSAGGERALRIDGFQAAADDVHAAYMGMMTHLPMLVHPEARRILVICFGTGTTAGAGLLYPGTRVDAVDIDQTVFDFAPYFSHVNRGVWKDPRARLIVDDGRNYLLTTREGYDVITSEPMPPTFAGVVNLYSREYYQLARRRLNPGGILVQWLPFHILSRQESWAILRTVRDVFPHTTLWTHHGNGIIVARFDGEVTIDLARLEERLASAELLEDLTRLGTPSLEDVVDQYALGAESVRKLTARAGLITDDYPSLEFHPPRHRSSFFFGRYRLGMARALESIHELRQRERLPLVNADAESAARLQAFAALSSHALLANLYEVFGPADQARQQLSAGLARATNPILKARFLFDRARLAYFNGQGAEARRLVDQSLALAPDQAAALWLRGRIEGRK